MIPHIKRIIGNFKAPMFTDCFNKMDDLSDLYQLVLSAIVDEPPISVRDGGIIKEGYSDEADELRNAKIKGKNGFLSLKCVKRKEQA